MTGVGFPGADGRRRRGLVRRLVLIGVLVVVLVASAALWPRQQRGPLAVPTASAGAAAAGAVRGPLLAERRGGTVCFAIDAGGGTAPLLLPPGWSADAQRALLDRSGGVVAQPGDEVLVTGTPGDVGRVPGCGGTGRIWSVASVALR